MEYLYTVQVSMYFHNLKVNFLLCFDMGEYGRINCNFMGESVTFFFFFCTFSLALAEKIR